MKRTNQFARTDRDIVNAFLTLLDQKSFEKITVADIIGEARINRSTFYQHFQDKYAILELLQETYARELGDLINSFTTSDTFFDLEQIDRIMKEYFAKKRGELKKLLAIRTETVNIEKMMEGVFAEYIRNNHFPHSDLELAMFSGLLVSFFSYYLDHPEIEDNFSSQLFTSYFDLTLQFFRMQDIPQAREEFLALIRKYAAP